MNNSHEKLYSAANKAARYISKTSNIYWSDVQEDMVNEGICAILEQPEEDAFLVAKRAIDLFVKKQLLQRGMTGGARLFSGSICEDTIKDRLYSKTSSTSLSIHKLAKYFYSLASKRGKRGRRSSVRMAFCIIEKLSGTSVSVIAEHLCTSRRNAQRYIDRGKCLIRQV